jgi:hypothetical protein
MNINAFNENFEFFDEDSNSYLYDNINHNLLNNFNFFSSSNTADFFQNETQYTNRLYYKTGEKKESQPLLNKSNKDQDKDNNNDLNKPKEKIIFNIEHIKEKKIISVKKIEKIKEINNNIKNESTHNKYADDNILRKCKFIILNQVMDFINVKIKEIYKHIGYGTKIKQLKKINKDQVTNIKTDYNIIFLNKQLKDIFSEKISTRYTRYPSNKNENLINELINEKDNEKKVYFNNLFSLTFSDCLNHFTNKKLVPILNGLELFKDIINDSKKLKKINVVINDKEYIEELRNYIENFENILRRKRIRKSKKKISNMKNS